MNTKEDRLSIIFRLKEEFENRFFDLVGISQQEREELTLQVVMMLISETTELLREMNYKLLKTEFVELDKGKIFEEIIDIGHFYIFLCLIWGLDSDSFFEEFLKKNKKIVERSFLE